MNAHIAMPHITTRRLKLLAEVTLAIGIFGGGSYYIVRGTAKGLTCIAAMENAIKPGADIVKVVKACPLLRSGWPSSLPLPAAPTNG